MKRITLIVGTALLFANACGSDASSPQPASSPPPTTPAAASTAPAQATTAATGLDSPRVAAFRRLVDAVNRGDADEALTAVTEDIVWERGGQCPPRACVGKPAVQRELARDVAAHHQLRLLSADTAASPIIRLELQTDGTRRANVDRVIQFFAIEVKDDKISSVRVSFDLSDTVTAAFVASQAGAQR